ncbi:MAG: TonB-dependent receptor domain-containing protein, partial [Candidatus Poribacteria bacterium]
HYRHFKVSGRKILSLPILIAVFINIQAVLAIGDNDYGNIAGIVVDAETKQPIVDARVKIVKTEFVTFSDGRGEFSITNAPGGIHEIIASMPGYSPEVRKIQVVSDKTVDILFQLKRVVVSLDEIIVSATRMSSSLDMAPAFASVISSEQIISSTASDLGELLETSGFLQLRDYGVSSSSMASMRGSSSEQVLVLVDGERLNDSRSGGADFDNIPLNIIDRVEIVRGGQSALYGADAMGGIINIVTKKPGGNFIRSWGQAGSFGSLGWGTEVGGKFAKFSGLVSFSQNRSDGDFQFKDKWNRMKIRQNAQFSKRNIFANLGWRPLKSAYLKLSGEHYYADKGDPGPIGQYSPQAFKEDENSSLKMNYEHQLRTGVLGKLTLYGRDSTLHYVNPGIYKTDDIHGTNAIGGEFQTQILMGESSPLTLGLSLKKEDISSTALGERHRNSISGYGQQEFYIDIDDNALKLSKIVLFPALRWDDYTDFDAGVSPKLGFLARFFRDGNLTVKGSVGKSYRAPTMNDLYWPEDAFAKGNPLLKPERSVDFESGLSFALSQIKAIPKRFYGGTEGAFRGSIVYFRNHFQDRILWSPSIGGKWTPENLSDANIRGVEAEASLRISRISGAVLDLSVDYSFLKAEDSLGRQLLYQPKHSGNYNVRINAENIWMQFEGMYKGRRYYTRENTKWLEPFIIHNIKLGFEKIIGTTKLSVILELKNVYDVNYQLIADYPLPGRQWRCKVSTAF